MVDGLTEIGGNMFRMADGRGNAVKTLLGSITIPSTITLIGFLYKKLYCSNEMVFIMFIYMLLSLIVECDILYYYIISFLLFCTGNYAFGACSSLSEVILTKGLTVIGSGLIGMVDGNSVAVPTPLASVTIPSTLTSIGNLAHSNYFNLAESILIGSFAFSPCSSLSEVTLVSGLTVIGNSMFRMIDGFGDPIPSSLGTITIPSTVTSIGN